MEIGCSTEYWEKRKSFFFNYPVEVNTSDPRRRKRAQSMPAPIPALVQSGETFLLCFEGEESFHLLFSVNNRGH
ncbi:hypothetical protein CEXT_484141 [Caerostris extrusa]|uniref:Uncharacterized protein n=1 Tax=Caerostris extrusa TaxID=172846 RepID=A0AAV4NVA9_CAEEX|nr:hypothetical protein CEXT_484141 [Caerostris extrusa]